MERSLAGDRGAGKGEQGGKIERRRLGGRIFRCRDPGPAIPWQYTAAKDGEVNHRCMCLAVAAGCYISKMRLTRCFSPIKKILARAI
jgi:hypothetical protein